MKNPTPYETQSPFWSSGKVSVSQTNTFSRCCNFASSCVLKVNLTSVLSSISYLNFSLTSAAALASETPFGFHITQY